MDIGCGASAGGSGGGGSDLGSNDGNGNKRRRKYLEISMKAMNDKLVKENAEKSAKIRRLMEENVKLEKTVLRLENLPNLGPGPNRPMMSLPNPFCVFPPEVWKVIIEKITRYSDLEMFFLAFPQLQPLMMERKKTTLLFEKVLPLISKHLGWKDIINCRLVCEKWNQDLCAIVTNSHAPNLPLTTSSVPVLNCGPSARFCSVYTFVTPTKIENFLRKMTTHSGNPLFGRFLRFSVHNQTVVDNFWKSAFKVVEKFGEHVWSFEISYLRECYNLIDFYKGLQQLLVHLPNLRNLQVNCFVRGKGPSEEKMNMAAQFWNYPLPPLPYLQSLNLGLTGETGMINAFTPYFSNQIRHLEFLRETLGNVNLKAESLRGLINLQCLEVQLRSEKDVLHLLKFPTTNLKKLVLYAYPCSTAPDPDSISSEEFASLSQKFGHLEHLDLKECPGEISSFLGSNIEFSGLKTLEIQFGVGEDDLQNNLDYLLWIPSLKHLVIQIISSNVISNIDDYDKNSALKIRKYLLNHEEMLDSNIWTLVPSLELMELKGRRSRPGDRYLKGNGVFTRKMFENHRVG